MWGLLRLAGRHPPALAGSKHKAGRHCGAKYFMGVKMDLSRVAMVIGRDKLALLQQARVAVIGLGGVGSYTAEALCRSGIGHLLLVDADIVAASNINRQLPALTSTLGVYKTEVVRNRLLDINPECEINIISRFYQPGDFTEFFADNFTCIADAIDSTASKIDILIECVKRKVPVISSMGTGNKIDPTQLTITDISKTSGCPLARSVRRQLRNVGIAKGVTVVYSREPVKRTEPGSVPGSMVFVPATAGLLLASYIVRRIIGET